MKMNNPAAEAALGQEPELSANVVRERPLSATHDDWGEEQMAFVDQARGHRLAGERGTANCDVAVRGLLQPCDRAGIEIVLDPCPHARWRLERAGVHDLFGRSPDL